MKFYHWASKPVKLRRMSYLQSGNPKPNGLWFDAGEDWRQWCEAMQFRLEDLRYRHNVTILDTSGILYLRRAKDIDAFTRTYGRNISGGIRLLQNANDRDAFTRKYGRDLFSEIQAQFSNYIMWEEVAAKYSGIIIVPYRLSRRDTYLWYYGWHCASGCVWDTNVIRLGRPFKLTR